MPNQNLLQNKITAANPKSRLSKFPSISHDEPSHPNRQPITPPQLNPPTTTKNATKTPPPPPLPINLPNHRQNPPALPPPKNPPRPPLPNPDPPPLPIPPTPPPPIPLPPYHPPKTRVPVTARQPPRLLPHPAADPHARRHRRPPLSQPALHAADVGRRLPLLRS